MAHVTEGRPLAVVAGRNSYVKDRLKLFTEAGLKNTTLVPTPLAFINLMYHEAGDIIAVDRPVVDKKTDKADKGKDAKAEAKSTPEVDNANASATNEKKEPRPVVIALDVGCESTTISIVADDRFWFRTVDVAGDSFCTALSKGLVKTYVETDKLKMRPVECPGMALAFQQMEPVLAQHWERIKQILSDQDPYIGEAKIHHFLLSGGAVLLFGYSQPAVK